MFNVFTSPPAPGETCPKTGGAHDLFQRPDDNEATVADRLKVYDEKTSPLAQFYAERGLLRRIDAEGDLDAVTARLEAVLAAAGKQTRHSPDCQQAHRKKRCRQKALSQARQVRKAEAAKKSARSETPALKQACSAKAAKKVPRSSESSVQEGGRNAAKRSAAQARQPAKARRHR